MDAHLFPRTAVWCGTNQLFMCVCVYKWSRSLNLCGYNPTLFPLDRRKCCQRKVQRQQHVRCVTFTMCLQFICLTFRCDGKKSLIWECVCECRHVGVYVCVCFSVNFVIWVEQFYFLLQLFIYLLKWHLASAELPLTTNAFNTNFSRHLPKLSAKFFVCQLTALIKCISLAVNISVHFA